MQAQAIDTDNTSKTIGTLTFNVYDFRGQRGFPSDDKGFVYEYKEQRQIFCKYTRVAIKRDARYVLRTDGTGQWRIDLLPKLGPAETVYAVGGDRTSYWPSVEDAAKSLQEILNEIEVNSSVA